MRKTKKEPVLITIQRPGQIFKARIPLWKAYLILAEAEE